MPNIPLRVNSLATEHPNNAQNSDKMPTFDAIFSHLSAIASHNSHQIIALLPSSDANWPAALIAERLTQAGSKQHLQKQHLHLHLFAQHQASWLKALAESETLASPAKEQIKAICDARVSGSHRLKLVNARLIIDIHLGDPLTQLKDLVSPSLASQAIQGWLANTQATEIGRAHV